MPLTFKPFLVPYNQININSRTVIITVITVLIIYLVIFSPSFNHLLSTLCVLRR